MTVDIRGISPVNRGAQLMMRAIVHRLGGEFELSSNPWQGAYDTRARLGLGQTLHHYRFRRSSVVVGDRLPRKVTDKFGLVRDRDLTGVLDASGFAYSDSFSLDRHQREAWFGRRWAARGVPKVLLPQAFGPFSNQTKASVARQVLDQADLVFVRDDISAGYLDDLGVASEVVRSVDFTIGLHPADVTRPIEAPFAAIVPNTKLVTSGLVENAEYVRLLRSYIDASRHRGLEALVVVHEDSDLTLARSLGEIAGTQVFEHADPLVLKGVLGAADLVVASRYHAVVGALAQGVKTVAVGWSHKYQELAKDFGVPDWVSALDASPQDTVERVQEDIAGSAVVQERRVELESRVEAMWARTEQILR